MVSRIGSGVLALLAVVVAWPAAASAQEFRCDSDNYHYRFCNVGVPVFQVQLLRKISVISSCDYGRDWGFQRNGIWVHHGCQAVFLVNPRGEREHEREREHEGWGRGGWGGEGGWGPQGEHGGWSVPGWAVGHWEGHDSWQGRPVRLTVYPDGAVRWEAEGWNRGMRGRWRGADDIVLDDGTRIDVDREGYGDRRLRLEWRGGQRMYFRRID